MAAHRPDSESSLQDLLRQAESPVRYDVEQGYARHQRLLASGAAVPEWASDPLGAAKPSSFLRKWGTWLGAGFMLGALATWSVQRSERTESPTHQESSTPQVTAGAEATFRSRGEPRAATTPARSAGTNDGPNLAPSEVPVEPEVLAPAPSSTSLGSRARGRASTSLSGSPARSASPASPTVVPLPVDQASAPSDGAASSGSQVPTRAATPRPKGALRFSARAPEGALRPRAEPHASTARVDARGPMDREEVLQLAQAEQLLVSNPAAAITLVRRGNVQFKHGYLEHERRYIEVMALFAASRSKEGRARAQWFLRDYRTSPYREKVRQAAEQSVSP